MANPGNEAGAFPLPYYAVIFSSLRVEADDGYPEMARRMLELASQQPGFLGFESAREGTTGITVSYWSNEEAIVQWKGNLEHRAAQCRGQDQWYRQYTVRVMKVERDYSFEADV